jgi:hypothetical protein
MGITDQLDYKHAFTIPANLTLADQQGVQTTVPASGMSLTVIALYIDGATPPIAAFDTGPTMVIQ